jgi:LysR family transcriptional regulator, glycine cleavage system transcriptional activator
MSIKRRHLPSMSALAAFEAVARTKSFTHAASDLGLTQGAISRQVQMLERFVGASLLIRTGQGFSLSSIGESYAEQIRQALAKIANSTLIVMSDTRANTLRLAIHPAFGGRWLMPRVSDFFSCHPAVKIEFATRYHQPVDFVTDDLDAAIYFGKPYSDELAFDYLFRDEIVPVCAPSFLLGREIQTPEDLLNAPLLHEATRQSAWPDWFMANNIAAQDVSGMVLEQFSMVTHAAAGGLGVAIIPEFLIRTELERGELVVALNRPLLSENAYYLAYPKSKGEHRALRHFRTWLEQAAQQQTA